ncbi:MAG: sigma-70 family RNA polymerase sigma factor [Armatimonadota bacterium]
MIAEYSARGNADARDRVVLQYKNLVESIARRFAGSGEPIEDLTQEGYIGLISAVNGYDAEKGVKFSTYATHFIIGQIKHSLRDRGKIIKEPAWLQELNHRVNRVIEALSQELGRHPTDTEIAKVMHVPEQTVAELMTTREIFKVSSLDVDPDDSSHGTDIDKVKDEKYTTFTLPVEDKVVLETAVNKLKIVEQKVIQDFYYTGHSQTEIAKKLGISCNYVSHILRSGTKKLRRILTTEELAEAQIQLSLANRRADTMTAEANLSVVDSLTGLYNDAYMVSRLDEELIRAARGKEEVAFAMVRILGLPEFGAKFGSMRRDEAVCDMTAILKASVRRCDIICRMGESEFGLILPYTGVQAEVVCKRVQAALGDYEFDLGKACPPAKFDVTLGFSIYPSNGTSAEKLVKAAEKSAKHERVRKAA